MIGIVFLLIYILYMYFIGGAATNKQGSYPYQFIVGYLIYSFVLGLGGMFIQILNLPWALFAIYMVIVLFGLAILAVIKCMREGIQILDPTRILDFVRDQWFIVVVAIFLTIISRSNLLWLWGNNASDDGYYISLVGSLPYSDFYTNPSTGIPMGLKGIGPYIINTIYTEYSVFALITQIQPTAFCRIYMAFFNYFMFGTCIASFAKFVLKQVYGEVKESVCQFAVGILLLFGIGMTYLDTHNILNVYDTWQFNTAMYYGSSIVRCMSIFFITLPFLDKDEITIPDVMKVAAIAVVLMTKSTIALPLVIVIPVAYILSFWLVSSNMLHKVFAAVTVLLYFAAGIVVGNHDTIHQFFISYFTLNRSSILLLPCIVLFASSFIYRNKYIIRLNVMMLIMMVLMVVGPFDNIFETASVLKFVAARAFTTWAYTFIIMNFVYLMVAFFYIVRVDILRKSAFGGVAALFAVQVLVSYNSSVESFFNKQKIVSQNPSAVPETTITLGEVLEQRYQETGAQNVALCIEGTEPNGYLHYPSTLLRAFSPHTVSLSATHRFGNQESGQYASFTADDQNNYNYFLGNPTDDTYNVIFPVMDTCKVNTVITNSEVGLNGYEYSTFLQRSGFTLYKIIADEDANLQYFVYVRNVY